jgi:SAM-dependent methyltransferase/acyl carrier protein
MAGLAELASTLTGHSAVRDALATTVRHGDRDAIIGVVEFSEYVSGPELRDYVWGRLGAGCGLDGVLLVDAMPLVGGALDTDHLRSAVIAGTCTLFEGPGDVIEERLLKIWTGTMNLKWIGVHDDFLDLGGDSMVAVELLAKIEEEFGETLDIDDFMSAYSIRGIANLLRGRAPAGKRQSNTDQSPNRRGAGELVMSSDAGEIAADLAANAALLEIAENLGLSPLLDRGTPLTLAEAMTATGLSEARTLSFLHALVAAGLLERDAETGPFVPCAELADRRYEAGYLSWSLNANRPYIDHAERFLREPEAAGRQHRRDGRRVAVSSRWIGSRGFYPGVLSEIINRKPQRIVDLGAGAGALLIRILTELQTSTGVALDLSAGACEEAERAGRRAAVEDRLTVVNRSVETLIDDPGPIDGADIVHAGFVMHDVAKNPDVFAGVLRRCREHLADGGCLVVTDAVPYADAPGERAFSALFSYLHESSMGVRLPTADQWGEFFRQAGFSDLTNTPLRMPGSRLFVATR